ncbi:hypothetical protein DWX88_21935 [Bacteroides xylanisolvens]|nr:hypothetical protein DWX88_21935 [Bacteroides xylanisolvens]
MTNSLGYDIIVVSYCFYFFYPLVVLAAQSNISVKGYYSITEALQVIENNSEYTFFYEDTELRNTSKKNINCSGTIEQVLKELFADSNVNYIIKGKEVIFKVSNTAQTVSQTNKSVRGTIIDEKGVPLPGVSIAVKGTSTGVIADINGYYIINANPGDVLVFSFVGFKTEEVTVTKKPSLDVVLKEDVHELEETVIVGMGKQRKASVIGSISSVSIKELEVPQRNLTNALSGRIAGAVVVQRSGEPGQDNADFWVRGISSFGANQKPLVW